MAAVRVEIVDGPDCQRDADGWEHYAYTLRLHYRGRSMLTPWRQGLGITEDPSADDVLESLALDASGLDGADGFEDWAAEYGCDPDSRKAERIYRQVEQLAAELRRLLGDDFETITREAIR